ncbi:TerB family tellurite resistance protein [Oerskovia sp. KBS0722]|uniref:tellurite resistance TerB family protein n=1 Tax=Oerskovia sp. KBS0722 TaxID=1179673 RepID=UPI001AF0136B|nr:TerB family tellurite resistance protein [Oerskovia sp. KBS0722]
MTRLEGQASAHDVPSSSGLPRVGVDGTSRLTVEPLSGVSAGRARWPGRKAPPPGSGQADSAAGRADPLVDDESVDRQAVEQEFHELREFVAGLSPDDITAGGWFAKLLAHALNSYTTKVDWQYFQEKYKGVPADAIVDQRIKMAARYAAIEGGLSAGAYTAAVVATIGSLGGASPMTVPAAMATVMVDIAFLTRLQLHLAYDIAVLYRVPLDLSDPDDLWKLIRVAFTIKGGEVVREGVVKVVPAAIRPLLKRFYSGPVLAAAKGLPVVGKYLLQRNVIKVGIPVVGVPVAVLVNRYTTQIAGRHARAVFRNEARVIELAERLSEETQHPRLLPWVAWFVIMADGKISDDEALLISTLVRLVRKRHQVLDEEFALMIDVDPAELWRRMEATPGDLSDVAAAAERVATVDGEVNKFERAALSKIDDRCNAARTCDVPSHP